MITAGFVTPISRQLPPAPWEGCLQIPEECESGWEKVSITAIFEEKPAPKGDQDILRYFKKDENGNYYVSPPWLRLLQPPRLPAAPTPRVEKLAKLIPRLIECIKRDDARVNNSQCNERYAGRKIGRYTCVATDGRRALMQKDAPKAKGRAEKWTVCNMPAKNDSYVWLSDPLLMPALQRIAVVTKEDKYKYVKMEWNHETGELSLTAKSEGFEGLERFHCAANYSDSITLDPTFVLDGLGHWPLRLYTYGDKAPVIFAPEMAKKNEAPEFYYIVMPIVL